MILGRPAGPASGQPGRLGLPARKAYICRQYDFAGHFVQQKCPTKHIFAGRMSDKAYFVDKFRFCRNFVQQSIFLSTNICFVGTLPDQCPARNVFCRNFCRQEYAFCRTFVRQKHILSTDLCFCRTFCSTKYICRQIYALLNILPEVFCWGGVSCLATPCMAAGSKQVIFHFSIYHVLISQFSFPAFHLSAFHFWVFHFQLFMFQ